MASFVWIAILCGVVGVVAVPDRYDMSKTTLGNCIIIYNEQFEAHTGQPIRPGAHVIDAANMKRQFMRLGFTVTVYKDQKRTDIMNIAYNSARNWRASDAFVMFILTQGDENNLWAVDQRFHIDDILMNFKGRNAPTLVGKPKLFFIEAPRGSRYDNGVLYDASRSKRAPGPTIPIESDFLIAYSTTPGYKSWKNSRTGSWFIRALDKMLTQYGKSMDLIRILTRTSYEVATAYQSIQPSNPALDKKKQQPQIVSMLTKDVYF